MATTFQDLTSRLTPLLQDWLAGVVDEKYVHETAETILQNIEQHDLTRSDPLSAAYEVLSQLDILNQQLIVAADVPAFLAFLQTVETNPNGAWCAWDDYWKKIDFEARKQELSDSDYYAV